MAAMKDPVNLLQIGANWGQETVEYLEKYRDTLQSITYIECVPSIARGLKRKMETVSEYEKLPIYVVEALVSDVANTPCAFHLASDIFASSSMFEPNPAEWLWKHVEITDTIELITTTCDELVNKGALPLQYDSVVIDVQGAELKVLKGMKTLLPSVKQIVTEYSTREFYMGCVLYNELESFLHDQGYYAPNPPSGTHGDVYFTKRV